MSETNLFAYHKHFDICFMIQIERNDVFPFETIFINLLQQHVGMGMGIETNESVFLVCRIQNERRQAGRSTK